MTALGDRTIIVLLLYSLLHVNLARCDEVDRTLEDVQRMLSDAKNYRKSRDSDSSSPVWLEYEFETGAGNREELVVTNSSLHVLPSLPEAYLNWQYVESNGFKYLASTSESVLSLYKLTLANQFSMDELARLPIDGRILKFKIFTVNALDVQEERERTEIVVVLCVESNSGVSLQWFRLLERDFEIFWQLPVQKYVRDLEFLKDGNQIRILLLENNGGPFGKQYSPLDVCAVTIDFSNLDYSSWLCQSVLLPKALEIQVCPTYERTLLALRGMDEVYLYEFISTMKGTMFSTLESVKSHSLKNFVCFESGSVEYLAISGPQAGLYNFFENEFQFNSESEKHFELAEIKWVKNLPVDTYRDESLLLIQLKNSTVIALGWQGNGFERVSLPDKNLDQIDLSKSTAIPNFGLIYGNIVLKLDIILNSLRRSVHDDTERIVKLQAILKEVLDHQEGILNETEVRLNKSYLKNPIVTGFWNLSDANVTSANISLNVNYQAAAIGMTNLTVGDLYFDPISQIKVLDKLAEEMVEISNNMAGALDPNLKDLEMDSDLNITGNINIHGVLNVDNLTVDFINNASVFSTLGSQDIINNDGKTFVPVETERLQASLINGIPVESIIFDNTRKDYSNVNFSGINRVIINGSLNFSNINGIDWSNFIGNVVWRNKPVFINGSITINGTIFAEDPTIDIINKQRYPEDYVLSNISSLVSLSGYKIIDKLTIQNLLGINTINDVDIDDFVILNNANELDEEITFEDLTIDSLFQVDGNVTGIEMVANPTMKEATNVTARVTFTSLNVLGDIILENSIDDKNWQDFEDFVQKTEENIKITGKKTFVSEVTIPNITITSNIINGHHADEFLTIDTDQVLPNLEKMGTNIILNRIQLGVVQKLERLLTECSKAGDGNSFKKLIFESSFTVNDFSFEKLNSVISKDAFSKMLNETFESVYFDDLSLTTLVSEEIVPDIVNGFNYSNPVNVSSPTVEIQNYFIETLDVGKLSVSKINAIPKKDFETIINRVKSFNAELFSGNISLDSLRVNGKISTIQINGKNITELYNVAEQGTVIFEKDISIETLNLLGSMNKFNFTERVSESVLKTDKDVKLTGHKNFRNVTCDQLETMAINGHHIEKLFDPMKEQILTGPITVNGSTTISRSFEANGKIGSVSFHDFLERFKYTENNTYELRGDFVFSDNVGVENISTMGTIQGIIFHEFLETIVWKDEDNVTITGTKLFRSPITFNTSLCIHKKLNNLDLKRFYEKAVFIDTPPSINSKIIFENGIDIHEDLIVKKKFETPFVMGVDMNALKESVLYVNKPTAITDPAVLKNVTFRKNIRVERINDIDMNLIISLYTDQMLQSEVLKCENITVENLDILGTINSHSLEDIYTNTFMLHGNQIVTGNISFRGRVYIRGNFDPKVINGVSPKLIALYNSGEKLIGNFVFKNPILLNQSLRVLGHLNDIDAQQWQATAVSKNAHYKQVLSGKWIVHGNVHIGEDISGLGSLNRVNITEVMGAVTRKEFEMERAMEQQNTNLTAFCNDLNKLKHYAENQAYLFNTFEFLESLSFNSTIVKVHHFEVNGRDYLFTSHNNCRMSAFAFNGEGFKLVANVPDFGRIDRWTFKNDKVLYFLTMGYDLCRSGAVNLWKLEDDQFVHVLDLGNRTHNGRINEDAFLSLINERIERRSIIHANEEMRKFVSALTNNEKMRFALEDDRSASANRQSNYEQNKGYWAHATTESQQQNNEDLNFKAGIFQKELFLYYDQELSEKNIFICNYDVTQKKILQTLSAQKPNSFIAINLENMVETLLIFIENETYLRIYEYRGIQGFIYRDTIKLKAHKLFTFDMRKYSNLARKHYIAAVSGNRLTILEAKMHGEKLDMLNYPCQSL